MVHGENPLMFTLLVLGCRYLPVGRTELKTIAIYLNDCAAAVPFLVNVCCVTMIYCLLAVTAVLVLGCALKSLIPRKQADYLQPMLLLQSIRNQWL